MSQGRYNQAAETAHRFGQFKAAAATARRVDSDDDQMRRANKAAVLLRKLNR